jgi:hypothetical protein
LHALIPPYTYAILDGSVLCEESVAHNPISLGGVRFTVIVTRGAVILGVYASPVYVLGRVREGIGASVARVCPVLGDVAVVVLQI